MTYPETISYLYAAAPLFQQQGGAAYKEGLDTTLRLDAHLGHPHRAFASVHIAGTNGKGSTAHTIAAVLQSAGLRVGLYTSPHLVDFRERIRINGEPIERDFVVQFVERYRPFFEPLHPSFFEITTALAFQYFAARRVDVAVVEVGLGGRLDCTNILTPQLSIITNISLDHTAQLGGTLPLIAAEKAGIIKRGVPVVVGETLPETRDVFLHTAQRLAAPIVFAEETGESVTPEQTDAADEALSRPLLTLRTEHFGTLRTPLTGECQVRNARTVLTALRLLAQQRPDWHLTPQHVEEGFRRVVELTHLRGRWETLRTAPWVVCDTGHNAGGWQYLGQRLRHIAQRLGKQGARLHLILGMCADKDADAVLSQLPKDADCIFTAASVRRALSPADLARLAAAHGITGTVMPDVAAAYRHAVAVASPADVIFVGGSTFVVADLLQHLAPADA